MSDQTISTGLIKKVTLTFLLLIVVVGAVYTLLTLYLTRKHFEESSQRLHKNVAQHLIDEKFQGEPPFLPDGSINKPLFGDLMHDMMAVNRSIEVYLLDHEGMVLYSVVLDHSEAKSPQNQVDLDPIFEFIESEGDRYILGSDPRNSQEKKIFSAAPYAFDDKSGYIYIILAGRQFEEVTGSVAGSYFLKLGVTASLITLVFATIIAALSMWFLTKNLREIISVVQRFKEGELEARVQNPTNNNLRLLAETFNDMADTIVSNIDKLRSVDTLRKELIANVSHDLRTPLAITQGYIETLQLKSDVLTLEERHKYLDIIHNSNEKLARLISQLFEYSKLEAQQVVPHKEPFSIADLTHDISENYQSLAEKKNIVVELDIHDSLPLVYADISLVDRVIQNLVDNALKFTPGGGVVTISLSANSAGVSVSVKDTGIGIPENELEHIFERFKKSESNINQNGMGLGLAIAKKILEIHNSTLRVISMPNKGTTFEFDLSLAL